MLHRIVDNFFINSQISQRDGLVRMVKNLHQHRHVTVFCIKMIPEGLAHRVCTDAPETVPACKLINNSPRLHPGYRLTGALVREKVLVPLLVSAVRAKDAL